MVGCLDHFGSMFEGIWEVFWDIFRKDWVHEYSRKLRLARMGPVVSPIR